jgi:hypothetical protein
MSLSDLSETERSIIMNYSLEDRRGVGETSAFADSRGAVAYSRVYDGSRTGAAAASDEKSTGVDLMAHGRGEQPC